MKDITIIIVTYNSSDFIEPCLSSIYEQNASCHFEIIVFDNNSNDDTQAIVKNGFKDVILMPCGSNIGFAAANNRAAEKSNCEFLLFLNPDTKMSKNSLAFLYDEIQKNDAKKLVLVPAQYSYDGVDFLHCGLGLDIFGFPIDEGRGRRFFYADGAALCIKRHDFTELGMFDEALYLIQEDVDLSWKARLLGYEFKLLKNVHVFHKCGASIGCGGKQQVNFCTTLLRRYHGEKNIFRNLLKNYSIWNLFWILPLLIVISFFEILLFWVSGKPRLANAYLKAYRWNFMNLQGTLEKRRSIQSHRRISDREIFKHMYKGSARFRLLMKVGIPGIR